MQPQLTWTTHPPRPLHTVALELAFSGAQSLLAFAPPPPPGLVPPASVLLEACSHTHLASFNKVTRVVGVFLVSWLGHPQVPLLSLMRGHNTLTIRDENSLVL